MGKRKDFYCCICHKKLDKKPIRLVKQLHDGKPYYSKYLNIHNYDFCDKCYKAFDNWIAKHKKN